MPHALPPLPDRNGAPASNGTDTTSSLISARLRRRSVVPIESTIPPEMTIEQWRRRRMAEPRRQERRVIRRARARYLLALRDAA